MARDTLSTWIRLDRVVCHDEGDGWGSAEPYLWPVFLKIDGDTVRLNDALRLEGTATVVATNGAHGNLLNTDVDAGETVPVPEPVGSWQATLKPIPVPASLAGIVDDLAGVAGVVVVLMEEDNVTDAGALAGYQALVSQMQQRLNVLVSELGFTHQEVTEQDIAKLKEGLDDAISDAVQEAQGLFENIWSWLNADDQIGSDFFAFSHDSLAAGQPIPFSKRWSNEGDWEIFGEATASVLCPADSAAALAGSVSGAGEKFGARHLAALRAFRDRSVRGNRSLGQWWGLAQRNAPALAHLLRTDEKARKAALTALPRLSDLLADPGARVPDDVVAASLTVLERAQSSPSSRLRTDAARASELVALTAGLTVERAVGLAGALEPKRGHTRDHVADVFRRVTDGATLPPADRRRGRPGR